LRVRSSRSFVRPAPSSRIRALTLRTLLDTGRLVAFLNRRDRYHRWATSQLAEEPTPLSTCEALADACLVRMAEQHAESPVLTLDRDFTVYRRHGRLTVATVMPDRDA